MDTIATNTIANAGAIGPTATAGDAAVLSGTAIVPANLCAYGDQVGAHDLLRVNFDRKQIDRDGLYLIEFASADDGWMGCRRFSRGLAGGLSVDSSGGGDWRELTAEQGRGMRVVGYVDQVYKPARV